MIMVEITQADREAYALEVERLGDGDYAELIRSGQRDTLSMIHAFARHRATTIEALQAQVAAKDVEIGRLREVGCAVVAGAFDHYVARNGRRCSIEGDDGEKCWIVPFDEFEALSAALGQGEG